MRRDATAVDINKVTHQGCSNEHADASLLACDTPSAGEPTIVANSTSQSALASVGAVQFAALACRRCTQLLAPHVRQGYLRASSDHDHFP